MLERNVMKNNNPITMVANDITPRKSSVYPEPFAARMAGREKRALGDVFGLQHFGVNVTRLAPGACSALLHRHKVQEELIYILEGCPTLVTDTDETELQPGMCAGFTPNGVAHQLVNRSEKDVLYLEIGDRMPGDEVSYPSDDLVAAQNSDGHWVFRHKNGKPYTK